MVSSLTVIHHLANTLVMQAVGTYHAYLLSRIRTPKAPSTAAAARSI